MKIKYFRYFIEVSVLALVYYFSARFGLGFDAVSGFATLVWPPAGISLAALIIFGYRLWPGVFLGAFAANLAVGATPAVAVGMATGNTLEALVAAFILQYFLKFDYSLRRIKDVLAFVFVAAVFSTIISATIGVSSLWLGGVISKAAYFNTWSAWWIGDMLGDLVVASFVLVWFTSRLKFKFSLRQFLELIFLGILLILVDSIAFRGFLISTKESICYLILIPLFWLALRFGQRGAVTATIFTSVMAIWSTVQNIGPFAGMNLSESLFHLQLFMGTASLTTMLMASVVLERDDAASRVGELNKDLISTNSVLEEKVEELSKSEKELLNVLKNLEYARAYIEEGKARDEALIASIGDGLIATDEHGKIINVNHATQKLLGWSREEMIGKVLFELVRMENEKGSIVIEKDRPMLHALTTGKNINSCNYSYYRRDGSKFPVATNVTPIILKDKIIGTIELFRDLTTEKEVWLVKDEFLALASHQLRTPPTTIKWFVDLLLSEDAGEITDKQRQYLKEIYSYNERMLKFIGVLLNISRLELGTFAYEPKMISVKSIVRNILQELHEKISEKKLVISESYGRSQWKIKIDPDVAYIILNNIISNAVKYTPTMGHIDIIFSNNNSDGLLVKIADSGCGIPLAQQPEIFKKLFRAENAKTIDSEGTGLGLHLTKLILGRINGRIWFESEEDKGTTFYISIPG